MQIKGNVDAELVLHAAAIEYENYSQAIIVSADGDFHCLLEYLEERGKLRYVMIPNPRKYSALLRRFRKYFAYLTDLEWKLGRKQKERE